MRAAAAAADAALQQLLEQGLAGRTERQLAAALEWAIREQGASGPSFSPVFAAGPHGALPHARPRDVAGRRRRAGGDRLGRRARRLPLGLHSHGRYRRAWRRGAWRSMSSCSRPQRAGVGAVRAGAGGREVDAAARDVIDAAGHGEHFGHGLGHGVGLEVHEAPRLSRRAQKTSSSRQRGHRRAGCLPTGALRRADRGHGRGRRAGLRDPDHG